MDSDYMQQYECMPWLDRIKLKVDSYIDHNTHANIFSGRSDLRQASTTGEVRRSAAKVLRRHRPDNTGGS